MSRRVELIVSDLDGTLLDRYHRLSTRTIRAVRAAHAAGIRVIAATGRSSTSAVPRLEPTADITAAVCSNGSLVHDLVKDVTIRRFPIDALHVERLFGRLTAHDDRLSFSWETDRGNGWDEAFAHIAFAHEDLGDTPTLPHRPTREHHTTKIMVLHPDIEQVELRERLIPLLDDPLTVSCSGVEFVEVTGVGVNKSTGLQFLCDRWSVDPETVVAFGDNNNDVDMLRWAGRGIAVANATEEVFDVADEIIGHHDEDSVASMIEQIVAGQPAGPPPEGIHE